MNTTLEGKTILVTGATSGIGEIAAVDFAQNGARVLIVGRNAERTNLLADKTNASIGKSVMEPFIADLSKKADIIRLAAEVKAKTERLDVLLNNAGAFFMKRQTSADGFEMTFALNHLNYFMLTNLLLDLLKKSTPARIVNVSSAAHFGGKINVADLQAEKSFSGWRAYSSSKLMNVMFTYELARKLEGTGVTANVLHPGFVATNFGKSNGGFLRPIFGLFQIGAISPEAGAKTSIYLATSAEVEGVNGKYFDKCKPVKSSLESYDRDAATKLWEISEVLSR